MAKSTAKKKIIKASDSKIKNAIEAGDGILRLAPTWVPRSFLMPGRRIKLAPQDLYAYGAHRGGIDERWFASTTPAANENREIDEGYSYVVVNGERSFLLKDAVDVEGQKLVGAAIWKSIKNGLFTASFLTTWAPSPTTCIKAKIKLQRSVRKANLNPIISHPS